VNTDAQNSCCCTMFSIDAWACGLNLSTSLLDSVPACACREPDWEMVFYLAGIGSPSCHDVWNFEFSIACYNVINQCLDTLSQRCGPSKYLRSKKWNSSLWLNLFTFVWDFESPTLHIYTCVHTHRVLGKARACACIRHLSCLHMIIILKFCTPRNVFWRGFNLISDIADVCMHVESFLSWSSRNTRLTVKCAHS
jgi:hypothetical protein